MFDVGFWELVLVFGMGLMILGPERLPKVAAQVGRWVNRARRTASQLRRQLESEIDLDEKPKYKPPRPKPVPPQSAAADKPAEAPADDHGHDEIAEDSDQFAQPDFSANGSMKDDAEVDPAHELDTGAEPQPDAESQNKTANG